ncbi:hypothetical protein [Streptomyces avicenniae]|uniref:hypothetical protein n=1 Tax=Streptomyces avicenniae TaxID=500153 RepID=UPI0006992EF1|nr:hypothetical protein [Streptomyces avicenniae]
MDLTPYVDHLRHELAVAAEAGGADARALAERLTAPLESGARLTLLNALSDAMEEVTRDLAPGSVDVRLRGLDPEFVVTAPPGPEHGADVAPDVTAAPVASPSDADDGATARVNFRLPAHLKSRLEEAAARDGLSVNAWLVRATTAALEPDAHAGTVRGRSAVGQKFSGWAR